MAEDGKGPRRGPESHFNYISCLRPLVIAGYLELYPLALGQRLEAISRDSGIVHGLFVPPVLRPARSRRTTLDDGSALVRKVGALVAEEQRRYPAIIRSRRHGGV